MKAYKMMLARMFEKKINAKKKTRQIVPDKNMSCEPKKNPKTFFLQAVCASNNKIKRKRKI